MEAFLYGVSVGISVCTLMYLIADLWWTPRQ